MNRYESIGDVAFIVVTSKKHGEHRAMIDLADLAILASHRWCLGVRAKSRFYFATRRGSRLLLMHRLIMGEPNGMEVDHINRDPQDNRRSNLRVVTHVENLHNLGVRATNTSGYNGVTWDKSAKRWCARGRLDGRKVHIGLFDDVHEAGRAAAAWRAANYPTSSDARGEN